MALAEETRTAFFSGSPRTLSEWWSGVGAGFTPDDSAFNDEAHQTMMHVAWTAYNGQIPPALKRKPGQPDHNVNVNVCRTVVDKSATFLFGKGVTFHLDDSEGRTEDEKFLDEVWERNDILVQLYKHAVNGGVCGTAFAKIRPEADGLRVIVLDPTHVSVKTADDDHTRVLCYCIRWDGTKRIGDGKPVRYQFRQLIERTPAEVIYDEGRDELIDVPEAWIIRDQERVEENKLAGGDKGWVTTAVERWAQSFPPILEVQNLSAPNSYWGLPDIPPDVVGLNQTLNRVASNINKIIYIHGHPKTWSSGLSPDQRSQIEINPEGMIHLPGETGKLQNLEMQSELVPAREFYKDMREAMYETSRTPEVSSGKTEDLGYLSAMAMQILYQPLSEKTDLKRSTFGRFIKELNRRLLILGGRNPAWCKLVWPEVLPRDAQVEAQTAMLKKQVGFSTDTLIAELGGNAEQERERRKDDLTEAVAMANAMPQPTPKAAGGGGSPPASGKEPPARGTKPGSGAKPGATS